MRFSIAKKINLKKCIWFLSGVVALLLVLGLQWGRERLGASLESQNMAARWSEKKNVAQISCFFSEQANVSQMQAISFGHNLDNVLIRESITSEATNPGARMWIDAYAAKGTLMLGRDNNVVSATALGVGGEFFKFHPQNLLSGYYFSEDDLNRDYCIIDEEVAWQLFGASDVAGMMVTINGKPYVIRGVVAREKGSLVEKAGLDSQLVYVPYDALAQESYEEPSLFYYEIVMPNPVDGYAYAKVAENIGVDETMMEIVDNTSRFSWLQGVKLIPQFGYRSMQTKQIVYPFWENVARVAEDRNSLLVLLELPLILYLILLVLGSIIYYYRHKNWTIGSLIHGIGDKIYDRQARKAQSKKERSKNEKVR